MDGWEGRHDDSDRWDCRCSRSRRVSGSGLWMVRIVEAGETVGYDLGRGPGGCVGGLLVGELFCGGLGGGGPYGQVMLGLVRQGGLGAGDDEDLFELVEVGRRTKLDEGVGLVFRVGSDGLDGADGKAAWVDLVASGGEDLLAGLDAGVGGEVVDEDLAGG